MQIKPKSNKFTTYHSRIKHRLKRMLKERRCGVCNVTYTKHKPCLVLLSVKVPHLGASLVDNYRLKHQTGIVLRSKRYIKRCNE